MKIPKHVIPVVSFTEDYDPELDITRQIKRWNLKQD